MCTDFKDILCNEYWELENYILPVFIYYDEQKLSSSQWPSGLVNIESLTTETL
jgi:hypothetical protein